MKTNKYRKLELGQKEIRLEIMNMIIEKKSVVKIGEIVEHVSINKEVDKEYVKSTLEIFKRENIMVVDDEDNVNFIYPVSAHPTMHRVKLEDERELYAMCAIDALGCAYTFKQDIEINSMCNVTGKEIEVSVKNNELYYINNKDLRVLHINLEKYDNWAASC